MNRAIQPSQLPTDEVQRLQMEFADAREELRATEEALSQEQAAVNAFRLQLRLKIGLLVEDALELRTEKQRLLTRLQLLRQAEELGIPYDESDPFWQADESEAEPDLDDLIADLPHLADIPRDRAAEKRLYRELARRFHPDLANGSAERAYRTTLMAAINNAYTADDFDTLRDLAGEVDPSLMVELNMHDSREVRRLRKHILSCRRRKRRALQELKALRQESTADLWRRAKRLEVEGRSWWEDVRSELQTEIEQTNSEVRRLRSEVEQLEAVQGAFDVAGETAGVEAEENA